MQKLDIESFSHKKLNEVDGKEQYLVKISNRCWQLLKSWMMMWLPVGFG
jgi:hypothetical protein